ncbi:MAG: prolipoprotein diacylglyceryl transferase [Bdellovibrionaceae bacterium]|nr:prolipoprotein diacylglyceryl transferase [Pseudobdellovibrionaceae bacterium]
MQALINIFGFSVPTYFVITSLSICLGVVWCWWRALKFGIDPKKVLDLCIVLCLAGFVGGRITHVVVEEPSWYWDHPQLIFHFWRGGFVWYGGALFCMIAGWIYLHLIKVQEHGKWFDLFAPPASLVTALGRLGCFASGCCYGKSCDLPWALDGRHPTQLYLFTWETLSLALISFAERRKPPRPGTIFALWLILHSLGRFVVEFFRADPRGPVWGLSFSGWIAVIVAVSCGVWILRRPP